MDESELDELLEEHGGGGDAAVATVFAKVGGEAVTGHEIPEVSRSMLVEIEARNEDIRKLEEAVEELVSTKDA